MKSIIHTPTNSLQKSVDFYTSLNFNVTSGEAPVIVTDGKAVIEINPDRFARAGVKLYRESWKDVVKDLEQFIHVHEQDEGFLITDPSNAWIYLVEGVSPVNGSAAEKSFSTLGNFAGLSLETGDLMRSVKIWEALGFSKTMGSMDQGWVMHTNEDKLSVSFMQPDSCPHLFFNPSLSYFNGKTHNPVVIDQLRKLNIPIAEEITHFNEEGVVDNVIIRDPGGLGFFIFND